MRGSGAGSFHCRGWMEDIKVCVCVGGVGHPEWGLRQARDKSFGRSLEMHGCGSRSYSCFLTRACLR